MTTDQPPLRYLHLTGLALSGLLVLVCFGLYLYIPEWTEGTVLQSLGNVVTFVAVIAVLSGAELAWVHIVGSLQRRAST